MRKKITAFTLLGVMGAFIIVTCIALVRRDDVLQDAYRRFDTITINATYNHTNRSLSAIQTIDYKNRSDQVKHEVKFHIYANAYREGTTFGVVAPHEINNAFPNGRSFGRIDIQTVRVDGASTVPIITGEDKNVLKVLVKELQPSQVANIEIIYTVHLANIAHRLGWTNRVVNLGNFYPVPVVFQDGEWMTFPYSYNGDPFFNGVNNFNVTLTKPRNMIMASSGTVIQTRTTDTTRTTTVESRAIRDWAAVLSPYFKSMTRYVNRVAVNYFFLDDPDPVASLNTSVRALETFSRLFVQYPFRQLTVVQTDFLHGGMEYGEIVFISTSLTDREQIDRVIVHEIAHQWWYGLVGNDQARSAWIDEGLAEYSTLLFFDKNRDLAPADFCFPTTVNMYRTSFATFAGTIRGIGAMPNMNMNRCLNSFSTQYEYFYLAYVRGMLLFADLESLVGRNAMISAMSKFARENMFGFGDKERLVSSFERATNQRLGLFFQSYTTGFGF